MSLLLFMSIEGKYRLINTWHMLEGPHLLLMMYTNVIQSSQFILANNVTLESSA